MEAIHRSLPPNPREKAGFFSVLFFLWTIELFKKGFRKVLDVPDLFQPLTIDRSESLGNRLEKKWQEQVAKSRKPSLLKAMGATFWREIAFLGFLAVFNELCIRLVQPVLLGRLLDSFRIDSDKNDKSGYIYGSLIILLTALSSITFNHFTISAFHDGMKFRVAVCSVIYRKSLRLSRTALGDTAPGKVVNLLSNDVSRFDIVTIFIHSMWTAPMMTIIVGVLLWREIQWAGVLGIVVVFIVVPIQSYAGKLSSKFRYQTAIRTDERVRFMDEIISGVQVIKMYAWEIPFSKLITLARQMELKIVRKNSHVRALYMTFSLFTTRAAIFCTMMTMALTDESITAARIFVISSYFNIIAWTMSQMFVRGVAEIAEASVAFKRLQKFLEYSEKEEDVKKLHKEFNLNGNSDIKDKNIKNVSNGTVHQDVSSDFALVMKDSTARWVALPVGKLSTQQSVTKSKMLAEEEDFDSEADWKLPTLNRINLEVKKGKLIGIIGSVGAGKSSLLQTILEELPLESGSMHVNGKISYASQEPWVFAASVRQNILFGQEMDKNVYDAVIKACALVKDFEQLPDGDKTIIGERGASLSGGQRARISLARAIYRQADIYLLDDPLSAVDAHVGRHLFDAVIGPHSRLARRSVTRILVTHQVHFLKEADWVVIMDNGKIDTQGSPHDLANSGIDLATLLATDEDEANESMSTASRMSRRSRSQSVKSVTSSRHSLDENSDDEGWDKSTEEIATLEQTSKGLVKGSIAGNYIRAGGPILVAVVILFLFVLTQFAVSLADFWVSFWTSQEELRAYYKEHANTTNVTVVEVEAPNSEENPLEYLNHTKHIIKNAKEDPHILALLSTDICMSIHGTIIIGIFTIGIVRAIGFFTMAIRASQKLHDGMFSGIISAPMRFFDTNPSGRILNRFSKDMGSTDELLPKAMLDSCQIILTMLGSIIVASSVRPIFLVPVAILGVFFMIIRRIYLKTSKNIKRLEGITRSPVFTHLSASLTGLSTIRAFGAQKELIKEFDTHQDLHSGAWYMFISTATAFGLSLDIMCLIFMTCVIFYFLVLDRDILGDKVGLAITQTMALTGLLQWGIRQSAEVANQFMSVERILEYRDLEPEKQPLKPSPVAKGWPFEGKVEFRNLFYRYFEKADPVLKGISFVIKPQEKVGIVGRTGAGKSSLIGAIFRLANIEGDILIDDVNTSAISLMDLRSKVSIIPQDPVLFSGTLRRNLDPFEEYPDANLWHALEAVELKDIASGPLGLQTAVMASGSNFSVGQRQLVCLARAILRNNKILVLDEATANVDPHTDGLIQTTIRQRFDKCTVLTIAHRLHTIMDSDRVLVMNLGLVDEFDHPWELLQRPLGTLRDMVNTSGPQESERLRQIAREKYESTMKES